METDSCDSSAADTQIVWGLLSSLYNDLGSETISRLERAIYLRYIRAFDESIEIFESLHALHNYNPVIVSEHAEVNDASFQDNGPYTLLRALRAKAYLFCQGSWVKGRDSLIEIRRWLYGTAPEAYTDLQVRNLLLNGLEIAIP